jgi:hypothetical protein
MTVWSLLEECISELDEPFRRSEIIGWFRRHHPEVNESTLAAHIQAATANAANRAQNNPLGTRRPLVRRVDHGLYVRAGQPREPAVDEDEQAQPGAGWPEPGRRFDADVILIGCVRTKKAVASAASELFASPLFEGRRWYAVSSGRPWYILSAKFGLLAAGDVIGPYDVYLAAQSPGYRKAWGEFVTAQLERHEHALSGRRIEVHAGAAYVDPLRGPLAVRGAVLAVPLAHLRQGEQLAWYGRHPAGNSPGPRSPVPPGGAVEASASDLAQLLSDPSRALSPRELLGGEHHDLLVPGLYSWRVDDQGATDLSRGLGLPVSGGLIYAGQAGATRWPSGKRTQGTLWGRITGMHLGGAAEFSTFRRTLAAVLRPVLGLDTEDDPKLSAWISTHLEVNAVPVPDPDRLAEAETAVLDLLDSPLNLRGRPPTAIRARLAELRRDRQPGLATDNSGPACELLAATHPFGMRRMRMFRWVLSTSGAGDMRHRLGWC